MNFENNILIFGKIGDTLLSGENFQQLADVYLGYAEDFTFNPVIAKQVEKQIVLTNINGAFNNPPILFLYPHRLAEFVEKLKYFCNPFTLITHNSDTNIKEDSEWVQAVLNSPLLNKWWAQNLCFIHPKMHLLPIGIANSMWEHGNQALYKKTNNTKTKEIHNNFNIYTNVVVRRECADAIESRASMLPMVSAKENAERLAQYKYCVCPEGNGVDTHRLWESLYLGCMPIVMNTPFTRVINHYTCGELPLVIIDSWWDFDLPAYKGLTEPVKWLDMNYYLENIRK